MDDVETDVGTELPSVGIVLNESVEKRARAKRVKETGAHKV